METAKKSLRLFSEAESQRSPKRRFFDAVFLVGFLCCLVPGAFPGLTTPASLLLFACIGICFFDENFYMYAALFLYMRYKMLLGDTPVFRLYSYLVVVKLILRIFKTQFRIVYLPLLLTVSLHSVFAVPQIESLRIGLNVIVDCVLIYCILSEVLRDTRLTRKFLYAFLLGGVTSGVYGWTCPDVSVDINVMGAGAQTVNRNFGALGDSNFAGLFYSLCILCSLIVKGIPTWARAVFLAMFSVMLLQTASLSALLVLFVFSVFLIILKWRARSIPILLVGLVLGVIGLTLLLSVPAFQKIEAIAGLIIRIKEKLSYIPRGRWDLLTTDRSAIWGELGAVFTAKSWWGKLIGGSVITVYALDKSITKMACHNSYLQSILNFGILGTLLIYIPFLCTFIWRLYGHFTKKSGYENEDIKIVQLVFMLGFLVFGFTVDFFVDWPFMMFYFI